MKKCYLAGRALLVLAAAAQRTTPCGKSEHTIDPDATGDEPVSFGVDGSKTLNDLDEEETEAFCTGFFDFIGEFMSRDDFVTGACIVDSANSSESVSDCEENATSCGTMKLDPNYYDAAAASCAENFDAHGCDLTIEEVEACLNDQAAQLEAIAKIDSCEQAFGKNLSRLNEQPASCELLDDRCSDVDLGLEDEDPIIVPVEEPTPSTSRVSIEGSVDGEPVTIAGNQVLINYTIDNSGWSRKLGFGGAELWFWQTEDGAQGALRLPLGPGQSTAEFLCIDTFELSGTMEEGETFKASDLSRLSCSTAAGEPLTLSYQFGYEVSFEYQGEQFDWRSNGYSCGGAGCELGFKDDAGNSWSLSFDGQITIGSPSEFSASRLVKQGESFGVACGGGGTILLTEDNFIDVSIDTMGALQECPGEPVDGQLSGALAASPF